MVIVVSVIRKENRKGIRMAEKQKYMYEDKLFTLEELRAKCGEILGLERLQRLKPFVPVRSRVLDVGCGLGYCSELLKESVYFYYGVEEKESIRDLAFALYDSVRTNFKTFVPSEQNFWDVVLLLELLEHVGDPESLIQKMCGYLRVGGRLIITTPNATSWYNVLRNWKHRDSLEVEYKRDGTECEHIVAWDTLTLKRLLVKNGFKIVYLGLTKNSIKHGQSIILVGEKV